MSIFYERRQWEPMEAYYFRSTFDFKDICVVTNQGDCWELLFYKGSANPGPFYYDSFAKAKRHVFRYLEPREDRITGGPRHVPICGGNDTRPPPGLHSVHPSRKPKRKNWALESGE